MLILFISKIYNKCRIFNLVTIQYQSSRNFLLFFISQVIIKIKTNKIGVNKTLFFRTVHHKVIVTFCRCNINFHLLLADRNLDKLLRDELNIV